MIHCEIVTPIGIYKKFDTPILNVETIDGNRGILVKHTPLVTMLKVGKLSSIENNVRCEYSISGGLLYFENDVAKILTDSIEFKDDIDEERAINAKERAMKRLELSNEEIDRKRAEYALKKANNRIKIKGSNK